MDKFKHFLEAQGRVYPQVIKELKEGHKKTHWMWFVFPQLKGLGTSPMSIRYAIEDERQAKEYWDHPILGERLKECFNLVESSSKTPEQVFSPIDVLKYRSCQELFSKFFK